MLAQTTHADDFEGLLREVFVAICELPVPEGLIATADWLDAGYGETGGDWAVAEFSPEVARP